MNARLISAVRCATKDIIEAITGNKPKDYTSLLTSIKDSVSAIDKNTNEVEALLVDIRTTTGDTVTNTAQTVTKLTEAVNLLKAIDANTDKQEEQLNGILAELVKKAKIPTNVGEVCAKIDGIDDPINVVVMAWHTDEGDHLKSTFIASVGGKIEHYTEEQVTIVDDCDCACSTC